MATYVRILLWCGVGWKTAADIIKIKANRLKNLKVGSNIWFNNTTPGHIPWGNVIHIQEDCYLPVNKNDEFSGKWIMLDIVFWVN